MVACYYVFGQAIGELTPDDTMYVSLPLFHSNSQGAGCASVFGGGAALAISRKFSVSHFWDEVRKYNATAFNYIGEVCRYLMNQPPKPDDSENSVRVVIGAGLRHEIWKDFKERFNIEKIGEYYSATEAVAAFANVLNFDCTVGYCFGSYAIVKYDHEEDTPIRGEDGYMQRVEVGESGLLLFELTGTSVFRGYTDKKATEAKIFHNVFKEGDTWFNTGDCMRDIGNNHAQFVDRLGDTFRWKGHNISTTEVEKILNTFDQILFSTVYGVQIPRTDGRAGMASIVPAVSIEEFDLKGLTDHLKKNLPSYGIPIFLRFKSKLATTATFKLKKVQLKKEGFNFENNDDPMYVMLPGESEFMPLTKDIYENILNQKYVF
jgi:citronellyl-CoA synthetase